MQTRNTTKKGRSASKKTAEIAPKARSKVLYRQSMRSQDERAPRRIGRRSKHQTVRRAQFPARPPTPLKPATRGNTRGASTKTLKPRSIVMPMAPLRETQPSHEPPRGSVIFPNDFSQCSNDISQLTGTTQDPESQDSAAISQNSELASCFSKNRYPLHQPSESSSAATQFEQSHQRSSKEEKHPNLKFASPFYGQKSSAASFGSSSSPKSFFNRSVDSKHSEDTRRLHKENMAMFFADESSLKIGKSKKPEALKPRQNIPWKEGWTAPQTLPPLQDATGSTNEQQVATPHLPVNHPNNRQRDTESHSLFLQRASYTLTPSLKNEILRLIQWKINRSQERQKRSGKEREPLTSKETELQTIHAKVETVLQNCTKEQKACLSQMQANNAEAMKHALDTFNEKQEEGERALEEKFSALEADIEAKNTANFSASNLEILGQVTEVRKAKKICDDAKKICVDAKKNCVDAKKATEDATASCHLAESKCKDAQKACSQDKVACGQYKESCSQDKEACHEEKMSLFEKGYALLREKVQEVLSARGFVESKDKSPEPSPNQASFKEKSEIVVENELEFDKTGTDPVALSRKDEPVHKGKRLSSTPRQKKGRNNRGNENKIVTESEPKTRARKDKKRSVVLTDTTVKKRFKATLSQQSGASDTSSYTPKPRSVGRKKAAMSMVTPVDSGKRKAQALRNISPTTRLSKQSADDPKRTRSQRIRFVPSKQSCDDDFSFLSSEK